MASDADLVVVTTARSAPIASVLTQILLDADIPAFCDGSMDPLLDLGPVDDVFVKVRVPRSLLMQAEEVLAVVRPTLDSDVPG